MASRTTAEKARGLAREVRNVARVAGPKVAARFAAMAARSVGEVVRTGTLASVDRRMERSKPYRVRTNGTTLDVPGWGFSSLREMYGRDVYLWPRGFTIRSGDVAVDLGSNSGFFSLLAARLGARVVSVDAQSSFRAVQQETLGLNGCTDRVAFDLALVGGASGMFSDDATLHGSSHFATEPRRTSMAELLAKHSADRIDFLKIDIEGSEFSLFAQEVEWLSRVQKIAMEVHPQFGDPLTLVRLFRDHGFDTFMADNELRRVTSLPAPDAGYIYASRP